MKNQRQDLQRQIADLIPIVELCMPIIEEVYGTEGKSKSLPTKLIQLKKYAEVLNLETASKKPQNSVDSSAKSQLETEFKLDYLVDDLEEIFTYLTELDLKIKNFLALKERFEAVQEERIDGITPERIYKLLEKQRLQKTQNKDTDSIKPNKANRIQQAWQKILNYRHFRKIATTTAITTGIILVFSAISYSSVKYQVIDNNTTRQNKEININMN